MAQVSVTLLSRDMLPENQNLNNKVCGLDEVGDPANMARNAYGTPVGGRGGAG